MTARTSPGDLLPLDGLWAGRDSQAKAPALPLMPTAYPQRPVAVGHFCFRRYCSGKRPLCPGKSDRTQGGNPRHQQLARQRWGATGGTGAASPARCVRQMSPWLLCLNPAWQRRHTEARDRRPRQTAWLRRPLAHSSASVTRCVPRLTSTSNPNFPAQCRTFPEQWRPADDAATVRIEHDS